MKPAIRRNLRLACVAAACVALGIFIDARFLRPPAPDFGEFSRAATVPAAASVTAADAALDKVLPEVDLREVPFEQAVERARQLSGAPIVLRSDALAARSVNLNAPVTLRARDAALGRVLAEMCVGAPNDLEQPRFGSVGDQILVTTEDDLAWRTVSVRCYDVQDLTTDAGPNPWRSGSRAWAAFSDPSTPMPPGSPVPLRPPIDDLIRLLERAIAPDSWKDDRGQIGSIQSFGNRLVVTQSRDAHRQIADLLTRLRNPAAPAAPGAIAPGAIAPGASLLPWDARLGQQVGGGSAEAEADLRRRLAEVRLDAVPFDEAVSVLADLAGANIVPNRASAGWPRADRPVRVTLHLHDVTLADALRALLSAAGCDKLCFDPDGPFVRITSRDDRSRPLTTVVYNVRDWVTACLGPPPAAPPELPAWLESKERAVESLLNAVKADADPDSWRLYGGRFGWIEEVGGQLVVTETWETQQKVAAFLHALESDPVRLRAVLDAQPDPATRPAPTTGPAPTTAPAGGGGEAKGP